MQCILVLFYNNAIINVHSDYISLMSDDEKGSPCSVAESPSPPPHSPISQDETTDKYVHECVLQQTYVVYSTQRPILVQS